MNRLKQRALARRYEDGLDALIGVDVGDFVPWLNVVSKVAGGIGSSASDSSKKPVADQVKEALEKERQKQATEKAEADARSTRTILFVVLSLLGLVVVGGGTYALLRK